MKVSAIAAMSEDRVIGCNGDLPWHLPQDMERFKKLTAGAAVLMGRKTYESLPARFRPLPGRKNIVISRSPERLAGEDVSVFSDPQLAISSLSQTGTDRVWIIGGGEIYRQTLPLWDELYLTLVKGSFEGDAFFPAFEEEFQLMQDELQPGFRFQHYARKLTPNR